MPDSQRHRLLPYIDYLRSLYQQGGPLSSPLSMQEQLKVFIFSIYLIENHCTVYRYIYLDVYIVQRQLAVRDVIQSTSQVCILCAT
jgi:hypothetical protein